MSENSIRHKIHDLEPTDRLLTIHSPASYGNLASGGTCHWRPSSNTVGSYLQVRLQITDVGHFHYAAKYVLRCIFYYIRDNIVCAILVGLRRDILV